ncbi:MAG: hypothetical protein QOF74_4383, partial [Caballeronia mineralivorans]|nr:hypothetical protein [Caballeronia mineralivorans]
DDMVSFYLVPATRAMELPDPPNLYAERDGG